MILFAALPLRAEPRAYVLEPEGSSVTFTYRLLGKPTTGTMPVSRSDIRLDFRQIALSTARVELDASRTKTGVPFVDDALKGPSVLWAERFPVITFNSARFTGGVNDATVTGAVRIRGVTRPITLKARVFRRAGSEPGDLSRLTVRLSGSINRSDFGADGYSREVADSVTLDITARLRRAD